MTTLDRLAKGGCARVTGFDCTGMTPSLVDRLQDLGLRVGEEVEFIRKAPMGDPIVFRVCDYELCLRRKDARLVQVAAQ